MSLLDPEFKIVSEVPPRQPSIRAFRSLSQATSSRAKELGIERSAPPVARGIVYTPTAPVDRAPRHFYADFGKRVLDVVLVLLSLPFWAPLIALFALLVARDGHNPFYLQDRVGRGGRVFRMIKLRSMVPNADSKLEAHLASNPSARAEWNATQKLKADPRITRLGRLIRKTSIDELPQLINVLIGDMSLVGPRPFMTSQRALYRGAKYYTLRPGLTGFWQISNRNQCNFRQRIHFDAAYYRAQSLKTDLWVILRTVSVVTRGTGY